MCAANDCEGIDAGPRLPKDLMHHSLCVETETVGEVVRMPVSALSCLI